MLRVHLPLSSNHELMACIDVLANALEIILHPPSLSSLNAFLAGYISPDTDSSRH